MDDKIPRGVYLTKAGLFFCKFTKRDDKGRSICAVERGLDGGIRPSRRQFNEEDYMEIAEPVFLFPVDFLMYGDPDHE